jgi:sarcosine oxidase
MAHSFDVIVVGLGAMGGATAFHLARRGQRVLGLERFELGHARGSSHGESRIIREIYFEHPLYVPIVRRAYELWHELERESGERLLTITGGLMIGPEDGRLVTGVLESAVTHDIPHEVLSAAELRARFPGFDPSETVVAVVDAHAGYLDADACVRAHLALAARSGAELHFDERVIAWESDGQSVNVETDRGRYSARQLVISGGPWVSALLPGLDLPLSVERQVLVWLEPTTHAEWYAPTRFPIYLWEYGAGQLAYGFPRLAQGVKAAVFHAGEIVRDPDAIPRSVAPEEIQRVRDALRHLLPDVADGALRDAKVSPFTNTPDTHFLIDFHPSFANVLVSSPCSGHGFKFASAIGELQAGLLVDGRSRFDVSPFRLARFATRNS